MNRNLLSLHADEFDVAALFWSRNILGGFIFPGE